MSNFMTKNFYKQREDFEKSAAVRDKKFSFPDGVVESRDIPYIADGQKEHLMDVYRPQGKENETLPVIINIHGGGLLIGNKEFNRYFCARQRRCLSFNKCSCNDKEQEIFQSCPHKGT